MMLVSVIIPTHNRSTLLRGAIESVLAAKQDEIELEIIVVDDGSTDDTPEVVKDYPVIYLRQSGGLGPSGARNVGLEAAQGDFIAFIDDDDEWLPAKLTAQLAVFREHPEYGMVLAQMWYCDSDLNRFVLYPSDTLQPQAHLTDFLRYPPQLGTLLVRRSAAQGILFDRSIRWMEDMDWALNVAQRCSVGYLNVPVLLFRQRQRPNREYLMFYRSTLQIIHRHTRGGNFFFWLKLQPILWSWRQAYTQTYMWAAIFAAKDRAYFQSAKALGYALRVSPPHLIGLLVQHMWARVVRWQTSS